MQQSTTQKGLSGFSLKYLAMALMILDHIHYFFAFTGKIPLFFSMLGRLAAPLFLFCLIEGFTHTHDRKKYFLRIYLISVLMGAIQFSFYNIGCALVRPDGFFPQNQMLASFSILIVILQGFEWCAQKKWRRGLTAILLPLLLPFFAAIFMAAFPNPIFRFSLNLLAFTVLPCHSFIMDGGTATLLFGTVLYLSRKNRKVQAASFVITCILWDIVRLYFMAPDLAVTDFFTMAYEWMEVLRFCRCCATMGREGWVPKDFFTGFILLIFMYCTRFPACCINLFDRISQHYIIPRCNMKGGFSYGAYSGDRRR